MIRRLALLAAAQLILAAPGPIDPRSPRPPEDQPIAINAAPIAAPAKDTALGPLRLLSALHLTSKDMRFGGWSGMQFAPNGDVLLLSDRALLMRGRFAASANGGIAGIENARIGLLRDPKGEPPLTDDADSEGIARLRDGRYALSFELNPRLAFYDFDKDGAGAPPQDAPRLLGLEKLSRNQQLEAMTILPDGALFIGSERGDGGNDEALLWRVPLSAQRQTDTQIAPFARFKLPEGYSLTELAAAPNGDVYALLRLYAPLVRPKAQIRKLVFSEANGQTLVTTQLIAQLAAPFPIDNYEAMILQPRENGAPLLYVLSDDNYRDAQKTILLTFEIQEKPAVAGAKP